MIVKLSGRFKKEFVKLPKTVQEAIWIILDKLEIVDSLTGFPDCKPIQGFKHYYRIRVKNYRIGVEFENNEIKAIHVMTVKSRGDIYKTLAVR
jgi:mRNA interferase RelE/StbE